ncbi:MAG: GCN5-related N-acetyltransferase [Frankiales bacterium]|nr:GCN5-related N-acetyltransferase [Frankiales bacterium]
MTEVRELDPRVDDLSGWTAVQAASLRADRPHDPVPPLQEVRAGALAGLPERDPSERVRLLVAVQDGRAVGAARVELPLRDNTHLVYAEGHVLPDARRRGVGSALLQAALERTEGRRLLATDLDEPPHLADASPGRAFLRRHGYVEGLREIRRDLPLPVPADRLDALEATARERAGGYDVVAWRERCPDELVEARAALGTVMSVDAPVGDMGWQQERWDAARVREREQLLAEQGRSSVVAAALHAATGELVAFTEVVVRTADPAHAEQWETLVLQAHRGRRLGLLVKVEALRRLVAEHPRTTSVSTTNADTNRWMIAVNEQLGFTPNGLSTSWQRPVGGP